MEAEKQNINAQYEHPSMMLLLTSSVQQYQ